MRAEERRRNQQMRQRERAAYRDRNMSASYLEDEDEIEQESISAIKKNVKNKKLQGEIFLLILDLKEMDSFI
jgi:predicted nucleotidyltransferase